MCVYQHKIGRVVGLSSSILFDKKNPTSPINRRISIIVMTKSAVDSIVKNEGKIAHKAPASTKH